MDLLASTAEATEMHTRDHASGAAVDSCGAKQQQQQQGPEDGSTCDPTVAAPPLSPKTDPSQCTVSDTDDTDPPASGGLFSNAHCALTATAYTCGSIISSSDPKPRSQHQNQPQRQMTMPMRMPAHAGVAARQPVPSYIALFPDHFLDFCAPFKNCIAFPLYL